MALALITDRSESDVTRTKTLRTKINTDGWLALTLTEQAEWLSSKGAYNYTDLNRVGEAVQYLADLLHGYGYAVSVSPKTDWTPSNIPNATQMANYLTDLTAIKNSLYGTTNLLTTMNSFKHTDANNIERLLLEAEVRIGAMPYTFKYAGTTFAGEDFST